MNPFTLQPSRIQGYFIQDNINTISRLITLTIAQNFSSPYSKFKQVIIPDAHIVRRMANIQEEMPESISKMNQRVVMSIVREFMDDVNKQDRNNSWANTFWDSYNYQNLGIKQFDTIGVRGSLKGQKVHGNNDLSAVRFNFTY